MMSVFRRIALFTALMSATSIHAQSILLVDCQAMVFIEHGSTEVIKRIENFEFLINRNTVGFNFLIRGDTRLKLAIRDRSHEELRSRKITQRADLDSRLWEFEYSEGEKSERDHISVQLNTLTGRFNYQRVYAGLQVTANGLCRKPPLEEELT